MTESTRVLSSRRDTPQGHPPTSASPQLATRRDDKLKKRQSNPFDAIPPHSPDTEKSILGSMLIEQYAVEYCIEMLRPEHFYSDRNRWLFGKCVAIYRIRKKLDETMLMAGIGTVENLNDVRDYVARLISNTPNAGNIESYVAILLDHWNDRKRWNFALKMLQEISLRTERSAP